MKYAAFISYSHRDRKWAAWLHRALETFRFPRPLIGSDGRDGPVPSRLGVVFRDRDELPTSSDLGSAITDALDSSKYLVVICSPHAAASRWVNEEVLRFKRTGRENRIFPIIVGGQPNASDIGRPDEECFPPALRFKLGADNKLSDARMEFVAADARAEADGRSNAKLKLLAGLVGTDYDNLKQRERRRTEKRRNQRIAGGLALAVILAIAGATAATQRMRAQRAEGEVANLSDVATRLKERWSGPDSEFTPLIDAVLMNDVDAIEKLAPDESKLNAFWGAEQLTPLMVAMASGNAEATTWLISHGARPEICRDDGYTAVHIAVEYNQPGALEAFHLAGGDLEQGGHTYRGGVESSGLHHAAWDGKVAIIQEMLRLGVTVDMPFSGTSYFQTPILFAVSNDQPRAVELFLESGASIDFEHEFGMSNAFVLAGESGSFESLKALAKTLPPSGANDVILLHGVLARFHNEISIDTFDRLIEDGADVNQIYNAGNYEGQSILGRAVRMLEFSIDDNRSAESQEFWFELIRTLVLAGASVNGPSRYSRYSVQEYANKIRDEQTRTTVLDALFEKEQTAP